MYQINIMIKICQICNNEYIAIGNNSKYCNDCKTIAKRQKTHESYMKQSNNKGVRHRSGGMRFSGSVYKNSDEYLNKIKEKYKNGVTLDMITEMVNKFI